MVIQNGKVKDIRNSEDEISIPINGYVVSAYGSSAERINQIFRVGDRVNLNIELGINIEKVKMAISGGAMLVENGEVADFTHVIYGTNPRTAIGLSRDSRTLYLITIDGRQAASVGVTQQELAEILVEKGIYNAMNLDGGGSTTMVARELGDNEVVIENMPSDGGLRKVPNAVAVFNTNKTGKLKSLMIEVDEENVFVGGKKELKVKGFDEYYNPIEIDNSKIKWSISDGNSSVKDNVLHVGNEVGTITVTASVDKIKGSIDIDVLSAPNELTITPKKTSISKNQTVTFKVSGQNKNGFGASLNNDEVNWKVEGKNASVVDGVFKASEDGSYLVSASSGNATSYAVVNVSTSVTKLINDFESSNFSFKFSRSSL